MEYKWWMRSGAVAGRWLGRKAGGENRGVEV